MRRALAIMVAAAVAMTACADTGVKDTTVTPSESAAPAETAIVSPEPRVAQTTPSTTTYPLYAVGDIADCDVTADGKVARFLRRRSAPIATLGDTVYESGTPQEFAECFAPQWGSMLDRIRPAVGNHEYNTAGAAGYFDYFGERAGRPGRGWYAYNRGPHWRVIVLNSNCAAVGGCERSSPQGQWLVRALARAGDRNVLAYFHAPLYSTGLHGPSEQVRPLFRMLYRNRADIVLSGHDHMYERFAPQNALGRRRAHGVQQFVVGTGGRALYAYGRKRLPNTQARNNTTYGVLRLALRPRGYSWKFIPVVGSYRDSGSRSLD